MRFYKGSNAITRNRGKYNGIRLIMLETGKERRVGFIREIILETGTKGK